MGNKSDNEINEPKTSLNNAVYEEDIDAVKELLSHSNIDVNVQDKDGDSPLHNAARKGNVKIMQMLLASPEINPNLKNSDNYTPLHIAMIMEADEPIKMLLGHTDVDVNVQDKDGDSPLHIAARNGNTELVRALLEHPHADPNIKNNDGYKPTQTALLMDEISIANEFLFHSDVNFNDYEYDEQSRSEDASQETFGIVTFGIGNFHCSDKMVVSDPSYSREIMLGDFASLGCILEDVLPDVWHAAIEFNFKFHRVAKLACFHDTTELFGNWIKKEFKLGLSVDSGIIGFFDNAKYPHSDHTGDKNDRNTFYGRVCDIVKESWDYGIIGDDDSNFGAVSASGWGDGIYDLYIQKNEEGKINAIKIDFLLEKRAASMKKPSDEKTMPENEKQPYQGDLQKTQILYRLLQTPPAQRDSTWDEVFLANLAAASFKAGDPQVMYGPDGFPYFQLFLPEPNEKFQCYTIQHMIDDYLLPNGIGVAINPNDNNVDWALNYGDILNFHLNNEFYSEKKLFTNKKWEEIKGSKIFTAEPAENILPSVARNILKDYFIRHGIASPKVLLIYRREMAGIEAGQILAFNVTPNDFPSEDHFNSFMKALGWYLPSHYTSMGVCGGFDWDSASYL